MSKIGKIQCDIYKAHFSFNLHFWYLLDRLHNRLHPSTGKGILLTYWSGDE